MAVRTWFALLLGTLVVALFGSSTPANAGGKPLQIGMAKTFFNDIPKIFVDVAAGPFKDLMKETTGLNGELDTQHTAAEVAHKLNVNQMQLGVFHGHEFAWAQQKYPLLRPLMIAVNRHREVRAYLIVRKDCPAASVADLRGKKLDVPLATKEHCQVFLAKHCCDNAQGDVKTFFATVAKSDTPEEALDDVCRGKVQAALVDTIGLEFYKELKAPCYNKNLKILLASESFPAAVIVYKQGVLEEKTLTTFRDGLLKAHDTALGRDMMKMWKIAVFEATPSDYAKNLTDVLKAYPQP